VGGLNQKSLNRTTLAIRMIPTDRTGDWMQLLEAFPTPPISKDSQFVKI
jgi:hypothetical protein